MRLDAIATASSDTSDPAHDILHVRRVAENARQIAFGEGTDETTAVSAALLHELFSYPKDHPESAFSGDVCAAKARAVLDTEGIDEESIRAICYAIRVHSFSRGIVPETLDARILQDADRLDALGAIGIARCFSTGALMGRPFYAETDPFCTMRAPADKAQTLDHFYKKLLVLPDTLHTETARAMAQKRTAFIHIFLAQFAQEIGVELPVSSVRSVQ